MTKFLDSTGLKYVLDKISPTNGDITVILPAAAYTVSSTVMPNLLKGGISVNNQLSNVAKKRFSNLQFYTTSSAGFMIGDDSKYIGSGYYCGNGSDALENSYGVIQAYIFPSGSTPYDITIHNVKGTLS